jgi:hypothetical protein
MPTKGDELAAKAIEQVERDVRKCFERQLTPQEPAPFAVELHGSDLTRTQAYATSDLLVAVPWRFRCTHTGPFLNIPPTYLSLELRGTTFVDIRKDTDAWTYYRYVDFVGALHQIGASTDVRPALSDVDFNNYVKFR